MRAALVILCTILFATTSVAQKPNFTGVWQLDHEKSQLTIPDPPVTSTFIFIQNGNNWHMERTHFSSEEGARAANTIHFDRVLGGPPDTKNDDGDVTISRMFWLGNSVVLDQQITDSANNHGSNHVVYTLSADGRQLTALEHEEFPDGKYTNSWVFDRVTLPKISMEFPSRGLSSAALGSLKKIVLRDNSDCDPKSSALDLDYALTNLGALGPGVIVRSKRKCDCGATGNCTMYVYQRHGDTFHEVPFFKDDVPTGWAFGAGKLPSGDLLVVVGSNGGGGMQTETLYELFRGKFVDIGTECLRSKNPDAPPSSAAWFDPAQVQVISCTRE